MRFTARNILIGVLCLIGLSYCAYRQYSFNCRTYSCLSNSAISSCIVESSAIADVMTYASEPGVIILFDIDNTLAAPAGQIGTEQWITHMVEQDIQAGMSSEEAWKTNLKVYFHVQDYLAMVPVERDTLKVLDHLRNLNIPTAALTTRSLPIVERTIEQFAQSGIQLNAPEAFGKECVLTIADKQAVYKNNIIFCNNNDKGKVLSALFKQVNYHPKCVVFIDDKLNNLLVVQKECLAQNIRFVGIRYGYLDARVKEFDPARAQQELDELLAEHAVPVPAV